MARNSKSNSSSVSAERAAARLAVLAAGLLLCQPAGAFQSLRSELRMNGPVVMSAFEAQREVLQQSSAVLYDGRKEAAYGTVVSADGLIMTKASELDSIEELVVRIDRERFEEAEKIAVDEDWDIALIKVPAEGLVPVRWAAEEPHQGTWVVANGATSRSRRRALAGVISANTREIPLSGGVALGVTLTADASQLKVGEVAEGSGAAEAGLKEGDVLLSLDGAEFEKRQDLLKKLKDYEPGDKVSVAIRRGEEELEIEVELKARSEFFTDPMSRNDMMSGRFSERRSGFPRVLQHDILGARNSVGGPLLNLDGECVGVNIARANRAESFAIPAGEARQILERLVPGS
jgi:serine protease Do